MPPFLPWTHNGNAVDIYTWVYQGALLAGYIHLSQHLNWQALFGQLMSETAAGGIIDVDEDSQEARLVNACMYACKACPSYAQNTMWSNHPYMYISIYNTLQHDTTPYNIIPHHTTRYNTIQHNTIQYNTIQYNTIQYNTIQYHTVYRGLTRPHKHIRISHSGSKTSIKGCRRS